MEDVLLGTDHTFCAAELAVWVAEYAVRKTKNTAYISNFIVYVL